MTVIAYSPAMRGPFVFDDLLIVNDPQIVGYLPLSVTHDSRLFQHIEMRFLLNWFGRNTLPFHLFGLAIHLINGLLVFYVFKDIFRLGNNLSLLGLGLFWLHPIQTQAVIYMAQVCEPMCVLGILVSFIGFVQKKHVLTVSGFIFALGSKESALMIPALWLAWMIYQGEVSKHSKKVFLCLLTGLALTPTHLFRASINLFLANASPKTLANGLYLLSRFILPMNLSIDHDLRFLIPYTIPAVIITLLLGYFAVAYCRTVVGFGLLWVGIFTIPHALAEPLGYLAEHHLYIPSIGIFLIAVYFIGKVTHAHTPISTAAVECNG